MVAMVAMAAMMTSEDYIVGFEYQGERIVFLELHGKSMAWDIWRISGYYKPGFAKTLLFYSQAAYDEFLCRMSGRCLMGGEALADWSRLVDSYRNNSELNICA